MKKTQRNSLFRLPPMNLSKRFLLILAVLLFPERDAGSASPSWRELGYRLSPRCGFVMQGRAAGSFIPLDDGRLMSLASDDGGTVEVSTDDGKSWQRIAAMYDGEGPGRLTKDYECQIALKTKSGVILWIYRDFENMHWAWDDETGEAVDPKLTVWSIRSLDEGKTWVDRQMIADGYCGSLNDIIQTSTGEIVVPIQQYVPNPGRHCQYTWVSADDGKTWQRSNLIDIGGHGHHDGVFEGTLAELKDGRLMMLMRTPRDRFWRAVSSDGGRTWQQVEPTGIPASTAPGFLLRLASGRLALVWNPLPAGAEMRPLAELKPGEKPHSQGTELPAQNWRNSLQVALSEDEGQTWSEPVTVARGPRLCYPQMFERRPGEIWVSFVAGRQWVKNIIRVDEESLLKRPESPVGKPLKIVAFGSSTTAPRGSLIIYPMLLEWDLTDMGRNVEVINAGVGSDNTRSAAARFEKDVLAHQPDLVIIQLGINDSAIDVWKGATEPRVPIDEYERNLEEFVKRIQVQGGKVILMTPNPVRWTDKLQELYGKPPYKPDDPEGFSFLLKDYAERMRQVAARNNVPLVDSFQMFTDYGRAEGRSVDDLLLDGMHPNDTGHAIEADALLEAIGKLFPAADAWDKISRYFTPPAEWAGQTGDYRSPLEFADGTPVRSPDDWQRRRQEILSQWHDLMGHWPPLITQPEVEVLGTERRDNFDQLRVRFRWTPQEFTTGYLLIPDGDGRRPAVVTVYYEPETAIGLGNANRDFAYQLARRGFVALSIGTTEATQAKTYSLYYPGLDNARVQPLSMLAYAAANAWYVLAARPEVDPERIGIVGHSFGGKWAMFASCCSTSLPAPFTFRSRHCLRRRATKRQQPGNTVSVPWLSPAPLAETRRDHSRQSRSRPLSSPGGRGPRSPRAARPDGPAAISCLRRLGGPTEALDPAEPHDCHQPAARVFQPRRHDEPAGTFAQRRVECTDLRVF